MTYEAKLQQLLDIVRPADAAWAAELENMPDGPMIRFMVTEDTAVIECGLGSFWLHVKRHQLSDGTYGYSKWKSRERPEATAEDWTRLRTRPIQRFQFHLGYADHSALSRLGI